MVYVKIIVYIMVIWWYSNSSKLYLKCKNSINENKKIVSK